jgi:hypothetical protein
MEKGDGGLRGEGESPFSVLHPRVMPLKNVHPLQNWQKDQSQPSVFIIGCNGQMLLKFVDGLALPSIYLERMAEVPSLNTPGLSEYFRDLVRQALHKRGHVQPSNPLQDPQAIEFYLVNLLRESLSTVEVYGETAEGFREEPLAFLYLKAVQADTSLRMQLLKRLGDFSLFISGFFPESLSRQPVGVSYYVQMGENAYGCLSNLTRRSALAEIFGELARRFVAYVDILSEVSEKAMVRKDTDLLRLYELWLKTGSRRAAELLATQGILPLAGPASPSLKLPN